METNMEHEIETGLDIEFYRNYGCTAGDKSIFASPVSKIHLSYSLNCLKGGYIGDHIGDYYRGYWGILGV